MGPSKACYRRGSIKVSTIKSWILWGKAKMSTQWFRNSVPWIHHRGHCRDFKQEGGGVHPLLNFPSRQREEFYLSVTRNIHKISLKKVFCSWKSLKSLAYAEENKRRERNEKKLSIIICESKRKCKMTLSQFLVAGMLL